MHFILTKKLRYWSDFLLIKQKRRKNMLKHGEEFLKQLKTKKYSKELAEEALMVFAKHPIISRRVAAIYDTDHELCPETNPWAEETAQAGIKQEYFLILSDFVRFDEKKNKEEQINFLKENGYEVESLTYKKFQKKHKNYY
jgi:hypothetical protein